MSSDTDTLAPASDELDVAGAPDDPTRQPDTARDDDAAQRARRVRARRTIAIATATVLALWIVGTQILPDKPSPDSAPAPAANTAAPTPSRATQADVDTQRAPDRAVVQVANRFAESYATYLHDPDAHQPYREFDRDVAPALASAFATAAKRMPPQPARSLEDLQLQALPAGQWRATATLLDQNDLTKSWPLTFTLADRGAHPQVVSLP